MGFGEEALNRERSPAEAMMSLLIPKKTVAFQAPAASALSSSSDSDSDEDESGGHMLKQAMRLTTKHKLKALVGDALQLTRRNTMAVEDFKADSAMSKVRRLAKMRNVGKKAVQLNIPKLADLVATKQDKPIVKFRRIARAVLMLIQVCNICKEILYGHIKKEPWFALIDNIVARSNIQQKRKGPRAFVTFVPNEKRELVQLTFDVAEFKRDHRTEFLLTDEIRKMMSVMPGYRRPDQVVGILRCLKALSKDFANYSLETQKKICQYAFYDKYRFNRVIIKKGQAADGIYFVLSGSLIEKHDSGKHPKEITAGEKFGENDLLCGNRRRHTVLTRTDAELFYLHRQDYRVIFNMSPDALNPKNLEICKQHIVFQHFPMQKLEENPGVWSVIHYKYGQLIALDLNTVDWIYVIKSGEARVLKYLQPGKIDVKARRRKLQAMINSQSPFYRKKKLLNFMEEREYIKSAYRPSNYHPPVGERASIKSAPPTSSRRQKTPAPLLSYRTCMSLPATRQGSRQPAERKSSSASLPRHRTSAGKQDLTLPKLVLEGEPSGDTVPRSSRAQHDEVKRQDSENRPTEHVVIVETVELPGDSTSRSNRRTSFEDKEKDKDEAGHLTTPRADSASGGGERLGGGGGGGGGDEDTQAGHRSRRGSILSVEGDPRSGRRGSVLCPDGERTGRRPSIVAFDGNHLGVDELAVEGKRLSERRLSVDMQGGLFDKPRLPGQRRQSILVPAEGKPEGYERRQSFAVPHAEVKPGAAEGPEKPRGRSGSFLKTPVPGTGRSTSPNNRRDSKPQVIQVGNHTLPAFVQIETLHPGQVFGLRACLDEEERGPSVSLVSGECEVLQINKKFFMRHCDDAIYSLIRLKNKPFPSEEDLIDRLDINMQWEEYKQQTLNDFLKDCRAKR